MPLETFTISGLEPNEEVDVYMPIFTGIGGWPWASDEPVISGMVVDTVGDPENPVTTRTFVGTTDSNGVLTVSGTVQAELPNGVLHITLPDYGYTIDNAIEMQDIQGVGVRIGDPIINTTTNEGYTTIQAAIDAAADGDTIQIAAGTYDESVVVPEEKVRSITILGADSATIPTSSEVDGTIITGGMTFGRDISTNPTIEKSITVKGITFSGGSGLIFKDIRNVTVENNKFIGITAGDGAVTVLDPSPNNRDGVTTISNNYIDGVSGLGIYVRRPAPTTVIEGNHVEATDHNSIQVVGVSAGPDVTITGNTLINWDQNKDDAGGRAIRINFDPVDANTALAVTGNTFIPNDDAEPTDPNYVKITGVHTDAVGNLITQLIGSNTWTDNPDFATVILVNSTNWGPASITKDEVTTYYDSIGAAVEEVGEGETITLLADASGDGVIAPEGKNFTLDLNGNTYTVDGQLVGSTGTETNGFQLLKGSTITIKNGTITTPNETGAKILIQNYSNLTLDDVELVGADVTQYVLSNNFGDITLGSGTTITAATGQVAFDVYYGLNAAYDAGVSVTIADTNVVITGAYEYGKAGRVTDENWYEKATLIIPEGYELAAPEGFKWVAQDGKQVLIDASTVAVIGAMQYDSLEAAIDAAANGSTINVIMDCTIVGATANNKNLTFVGNSDKPKIEFPQGKDQPNYQTYYGCEFTFENLTLQCEPDKNYQGIQPDKVIARNCVINGKFWGYAKDLEFTDCVFNQNSSYNIWTYRSNVTFENCEFNSAGRSVLIYNEGATLEVPAEIVFKNCTFSASTPVDKKAAIDIDTSFGSFNIEIENCSASGFSNETKEGGTVISEGFVHLKATDKGALTVTIDGKQVLADGLTYDADSDTYEISNANGLQYLAKAINTDGTYSGATVKLTQDIKLEGIEWTPIYANGYTGPGNNATLTIDGNGHTISDLSKPLIGKVWSAIKVKIKNLTISGSTIVVDEEDLEGNVGVGAFIGYTDALDMSLENCHLTESTVKGGHWTGGLVGYLTGSDTDMGKMDVVNCSVIDSTIEGKGSVGSFLGHATGSVRANISVDGATVTGNTVTSTGVSNEKAGSLMGTVGAGTVNVSNLNESNNTVKSNETIIIDRIYGRLAGGSLVID